MGKESAKEESPLASALTRDERGHLVVLIGAITSNIREQAAKGVNNPQRSRSIEWLDKWQGDVLVRLSEAANTKWEPLQTSSKTRDWDELSWDEKPEKKDLEIDTSLHHLYNPVPTPLATLDKKKRTLVMHSVLLILLSLQHYYAPSRLLLVHLASSLNLPLSLLNKDEEETATTLMSAAKEMSAQEEVDKKKKDNQTARRWKVGLASVAGAALIGVTGGLAAPFVAAGLGTVLGGLGLGATAAAGLLGSLAGSSVLVGGLFGAYGARMTSQMVDQYAREVADFKFVPITNEDARRLRVTIAISGWLNEENEIVDPWRVIGPSTETFGLRWELETLMNLGSGLKQMVTSTAWNFAKMEILKRTVFASLLGALTLPLGLIKLGSMVDNPFKLAQSRADKTGQVLADALINRAQGERPVALLGYSLGARVIHSCLLTLQKRQAYGLIDSVILIGAPIPNDKAMWQSMRTVVSGRLINIYSENDAVLGFLYRANSAQIGIAGLSKAEAFGVESKDVSDIVDGHLKYKALVGRILNEVGWEDLDADALMLEHEKLKEVEAEEEEAMRQAEAEKTATGQEHDEFMSEMNTETKVERSSSVSPPPMPPRPDRQGVSGVSSRVQSMDISDPPPPQPPRPAAGNTHVQNSLLDTETGSLATQPSLSPVGKSDQASSSTTQPSTTFQPVTTSSTAPPGDSQQSAGSKKPFPPLDGSATTRLQNAHGASDDHLIPVETSPAKDKLAAQDNSDDEDESEPRRGGIQMQDNDPNLL